MSRIICALLAALAMVATALPADFGSGVSAHPGSYRALARDEAIISPYEEGDPRRCAINANRKAIKYASQKAKKEDDYAAMIEYKNTRFASRRANRATRFDANQDHLKDRIAVRKSIRDCKW